LPAATTPGRLWRVVGVWDTLAESRSELRALALLAIRWSLGSLPAVVQCHLGWRPRLSTRNTVFRQQKNDNSTLGHIYMVGIYIYTITIEARARVGAKRQGQGCQAVCSKCCRLSFIALWRRSGICKRTMCLPANGHSGQPPNFLRAADFCLHGNC